MSLINDALKRAQEAQSKSPPPALPPVPEHAKSGASHSMLIAVIVLLVVNALVFLSLAVSHNRARHKAPMAMVDANRVSTVTLPAVVVTNTSTIAKTAPPGPVSSTTNAGIDIVPVVANTPPRLKVQGIIFTQKPWAIVNGQTMYVGDHIRDLKVVEIKPHSVTFMDDDGAITKLNVGE